MTQDLASPRRGGAATLREMPASRRGHRHAALRPPLAWCLPLALVLLILTAGCRGRERQTGLVPPSDARAWEDRFAVAFDDLFTLAPVPLEGRAVHDVTDQRLLQARMGHADLVLRARVENTWSRRRYDGELEQIVELTITETLVGKLPKRADKAQTLTVRNADPIEIGPEGQEVIWFLRWAPKDNPPYHHHLTPADGGVGELADAMASDVSGKGKNGRGRRGPDGKRRRRGGDDGADAGEGAQDRKGKSRSKREKKSERS